MQCHIHRSSSLFGWLLNMIEADPLLYGKTTMYLRIGHNCFPVAVLKQGYDNPCRIHYTNLQWLILTHEYAHHISHKIEKCNGLLKNSKVGNWYICLWTISRTNSRTKLIKEKKYQKVKMQKWKTTLVLCWFIVWSLRTAFMSIWLSLM